ncbi:MAG TPA: methyltransferase [Allosphingosinicella sp.]|nr:methyltransferase [Allosphingosinicella sp.]
MQQGQDDNPLFALVRLASGLWVSRALWAAAHFRIADAVRFEPTPLAAIAAATGTNEANLRRLMNALVAAEIFVAAGEDRYGHSAVSPFLRSDNPISQRDFIASVFGGEHYAAWGALEESLTGGATAFDSLYGQPVFDWYNEHPQEAQSFSRAMEGTTRIVEAALLASWTPPPFELAVDIGGSRGTLLSALLARAPEARGILFDLPGIAGSVRSGLPDRIEAVGGNFFESVPEGDLYLLKLILHDWTDEQSLAILRSIRAAIRPGGRVAIVETLLPEQVEPHPGYLFDLNMMVMTGGRERSAADFGTLLDQTGFRLESVTPTPTPMGVVQAIAV